MKANIQDLAIFGGKPEFRNELHVGRPNITNRERFLERVNDILDRRWLTNDGHYLRDFESRIANYIGVKQCVAMTNGTIALEIAARALDLSGEVIVPSFTFVATPHALQWQGITPVFCDVELGSHHIDPHQVENMITPRTTAILGVHVWGVACDIERLQKIADRHHLHLLFDAAHAFGCTYKGEMIGNFGEAEIFSFHATKFLNSFEGGAVVTNNDELAGRMRFMRNFGFAGIDDVKYLGINGKMSEVSAAMGVTSLECIDDIIDTNYRNYKAYQQNLGEIPGINLYNYDEKERNNYQYVVVEVDEKETEIARDTLVEILHAENILVRRYFYPGCHKMEPYRSYFPHAGLLLNETEGLTKRVMTLPNGTAINVETVRQICDLVQFSVKHSYEINNAYG